MTPERWRRIKDLCQRALDLSPNDRAAFLSASCKDDDDLQRDVAALLAEATESDGILEAPIWERFGIRRKPVTGADGDGLSPSQSVPRRRVRLKGATSGAASPKLARRLDRESRRPRLQHPGIAHVYEQGEPLFVELLEARKRTLGLEHPHTLNAMLNLGQLYFRQGKFSVAEPLYTAVLAARRRLLGDEHPDTLFMMNRVGVLYSRQGRGADAESMLTALLAICRRQSGNDHLDTLRATDNLGEEYLRRGDVALAQASFTSALEGRRRALGNEHADTLRSMVNVAEACRQAGQVEEAESIFTTALEAARRVLGPDSIDTFTAMERLAELHRRRGALTEAQALLGEAMAGRVRILGPRHPDTIQAVAMLGLVHLQRRHYDEAKLLLTEHVAGDAAPDDSWPRYHGHSVLGAALSAERHFSEAEPLLISGYEGMSARMATIPADSRRAIDRVGRWILELYDAWGKPERAREWRNRL